MNVEEVEKRLVLIDSHPLNIEVLSNSLKNNNVFVVKRDKEWIKQNHKNQYVQEVNLYGSDVEMPEYEMYIHYTSEDRAVYVKFADIKKSIVLARYFI